MSGFRDWKVAPLTPTRVDTPNGSISVSWACNFDGGERERKAEEAARLVAAAPELLKELTHLYRCLRPWIDAGRSVPGIATLNGAEAAIAKATGGAA